MSKQVRQMQTQTSTQINAVTHVEALAEIMGVSIYTVYRTLNGDRKRQSKRLLYALDLYEKAHRQMITKLTKKMAEEMPEAIPEANARKDEAAQTAPASGTQSIEHNPIV